MVTPDEVNAAYEELKRITGRLMAARTNKETVELWAFQEHHEELKSARSNEARQMELGRILEGNEDYEQMVEDIHNLEVELEVARWEVARVKSLIELMGASR